MDLAQTGIVLGGGLSQLTDELILFEWEVPFEHLVRLAILKNIIN